MVNRLLINYVCIVDAVKTDQCVRRSVENIILEMPTIVCRTRQQVETLISEIQISTHIKYVQDNKSTCAAGRKTYLNDGKLWSL